MEVMQPVCRAQHVPCLEVGQADPAWLPGARRGLVGMPPRSHQAAAAVFLQLSVMRRGLRQG